MDWYPWIVFVHIAAAFLFVMGHGASMWASDQIRHERDAVRIAALWPMIVSQRRTIRVRSENPRPRRGASLQPFNGSEEDAPCGAMRASVEVTRLL